MLGEKELEYVTECLKTSWISSRGKYVDQFEKEFANYCGCEFGIGTTSGTTALHLALAASKIGPGDEVVVPTFTIVSTILAIIYTGAKPVLVDSDPETWNIDVGLIEQKITKNTKAILPVHMYGHPCDMDPILDMARRHKLIVIEDAAEVHGSEYKNKKAGGIGDIGCFSFYANKIITTGEGGMVVTNDKVVAERASLLKDLAFIPEKRFLHKELGFNYRMTNIEAAIGLAQLEKIDDLVNRRRNNARRYNAILKDIDGIKLPVERPWAKNVYWMYCITIEKEFGISRDDVMKKLKENGVDSRSFFIPMHKQPVFLDMGLFANETYRVAEEISEKGLYLPSSPGLTDNQVSFICDTIDKIKAQ